ncbi:MAG: DNA primase, partial [Bacteroidetes bacterium]
MIKPEVVQQIQQRIDIIDVLGDFIKLKKRGTNYLGLCPFHGERTPSFTVSPVKEIYKCFGCGKSGNTITFLMEHEKFSYVEALKWLAKRYGIEIEEEFVTDEAREQYQQAESLYVVNKFAQTFYAQQLLETEEGISIAKSYLLERGFTDDLIQQFQVGYCPAGGNAFATAALAQQFSKDILLKTGMVVERNGSLVDNYRGRIIFPVTGVNGKVIGFGARVIGKAD